MAGLKALALTLSLLRQIHCLEFDFIIIGGGTAGLTVANRLSQHSHISVAVIEAGAEENHNPNVTSADGFLSALGTHVDWQYKSTNQTYAAGQAIDYHSGKALGGTSTINGMTYVRAEKSQIDSWGNIGNPGWSWDELFPYYLKSESFDDPTPAQVAAGATFDTKDHGRDGFLRVGYPYSLQNGTLHESVQKAWQKLGIPPNVDVNGGAVRGFHVWQSTIDRVANKRADAARAYYYPIQNRSNLVVYLNTTANKITWKEGSSNEAEADGVEITPRNGMVTLLKAKRGVVVSAGSLRSPAVLELSGVGNPNILTKFGISIKVDLAAVGENLQDQPNTGLAFASTTNATYNGSAPYVTFGSLSDFFPEGMKNVSLKTWAERVATSNNNAVNATTLEYLFGIQHSLLQRGVPQAETLVGSFSIGAMGLLVSAMWLLMPFSRGSVHITSADPLAYPAINPNYFLIDYDLEVQVAIAKWTRRFWATEPMSSLAMEISPGFDVLPGNATNSQWGDWVKSTFTANSHPLGTAAMMPRELGGVVDHRLKVYGTKNVHVVDASVMPFQVSGHLSGTIYAIAEKAADMILEDM